MLSMQEEIINALGVKPSIEPEAEVRRRVDFLKSRVLESGADGLLIGISGGVDSAAAAGLCKAATDELTALGGKDYMTLAVFQPYGEQEDIEDGYLVAQALGIQSAVETNIGDAVDELALETEYALKRLGRHRHMSYQGKGGLKTRIRMAALHALADENRLLVVGTGHASEAVAGLRTRWGYGAAHVEPLRTLNKRQIRRLAAALGIPAAIIGKTPTAGLWPGQTDEDELGVTMEDNSDYLEGKVIGPEAAARLEKLYRDSLPLRGGVPGI